MAEKNMKDALVKTKLPISWNFNFAIRAKI